MLPKFISYKTNPSLLSKEAKSNGRQNENDDAIHSFFYSFKEKKKP